MPQVAVGHVELDYTSVNLIESKSFKLYLNSFNQTRFNNWDEVRQTLERDLSTCAQGKISVALYRLDELEGQPIGHFNGTCIDDQDITIDNYEFTTDYLENATCGEKVVEETLVSHLLKSKPIFPGVLILEAMAQATGILAFKSVGKLEPGELYYFAGIDEARFKRPVVPGDQMIMEVTFEKTRRGLTRFKGVALVDGKVVCEATMMCARSREA